MPTKKGKTCPKAKGDKKKQAAKRPDVRPKGGRQATISAGAKAVAAELDSMGLPVSREVRFGSCRDSKCLPFDFQFIIGGRAGLIEFDGAQHFFPSSLYHPNPEDFPREQAHDRSKNEYALGLGIPLLRLAYDLKEAEIRAHVRNFVGEVQKGAHPGILLASRAPELYDYLRPRNRRSGCNIL